MLLQEGLIEGHGEGGWPAAGGEPTVDTTAPQGAATSNVLPTRRCPAEAPADSCTHAPAVQAGHTNEAVDRPSPLPSFRGVPPAAVRFQRP